MCWYYHGPVPTIPETGKEKWAIKVRPLFGTHPTTTPYVAGVNSSGAAFHTSDLNSARKFCNLHDAVDFILNAENVYSRWPDYTIIRVRHISKWEEVEEPND